jgi:hypothetical protein
VRSPFIIVAVRGDIVVLKSLSGRRIIFNMAAVRFGR